MPYKDPTEHREEKAAYFATYYAAHKKEIAAKHVVYNAAHREEKVAQGAAYRAAHRKEKAAYAVAYYANHRKEKAAYAAANYAAHREERAANYAAHREERCAYQRVYHASHIEDILSRESTYRAAHRKEKAAYLAAYHKKHPDKSNAKCARRRALKMSALIGATASQVAEIAEIYRLAKEASKVRCYLCGSLIPKGHRHVDHIMPLSKGGAHRPSNLAVACDKCNLSKQAKLPEEIGLLL